MDCKLVGKHAILQGDWLEVAREFPDDYFDLVVCSPPYEDARTYGIGFDHKGQAWVDWAKARYLECVRVCKGAVVWVVEGKTEKFRWSCTPALLMADLHRADVKLRKPPIFHRIGIPGSGGPDWFRNDYELCICSSKGKLPWSDNTAMGHPPKWGPGGEMSHRMSGGTRRNQWGGSEKSSGQRRKNGERQLPSRPSHEYQPVGGRQGRGNFKGSIAGKRWVKSASSGHPNGDIETTETYEPPVIANPGNVIKCVVGGNQMGSKIAHENEAPFPESLIEFFIRSLAPPGGLVLDCFGGSGTTAAVCELHGRTSFSVDVRESQCDLIERRVKEAEERLKAASPAQTPPDPSEDSCSQEEFAWCGRDGTSGIPPDDTPPPQH